MKIKVKGLVFVGFAAAILSANAALAENENTVTSKSFTEATYQKLSNLATQGDLTGNTLNSNSDTTYPSEKKVAAALSATGATVQNGQLTVTQNGTSVGTFTANQATGSDVTIALTDTTYTAGSNISIDANNNAIAATTGAVADGATTLVTGDAVYDAIQTSQAATTYAADGTTITLDTTTNTFSATAGSIVSGNTGLVNGGQVYTGLAAKEDVSNKTQTVDSNSTSTEYPSAAAVYSAIDNATGGNTIPEMNTNICGNANYAPCALVAESDGLHWRTIATATHQGGVLGDVTNP
ncbi:MAG: hypothetical protein J5620_04190 [Alphaproteobacteria bacterium]|nr:hypothetical protein [Alphaproteobacteria bacterium]